MGWNSWDCYGAAVTEEIVRRNAEYMAANLKQYGYEYIVVDIQWYEPASISHAYNAFAELVMDEYGRLLPAENKFPSAKTAKVGGGCETGHMTGCNPVGCNSVGFKPLSDYIHSLGLKFGLHMMRGIPRQAVHANTAVKNTNATAKQIAQYNSVCAWNSDMYGVNAEAEGAAAYYDSVFEQFSEWGVDFVKVDDIAREFHVGELNLVRAALNKCGREMVLSVSPGPAPLREAEYFKANTNMWRITDDFWDKWALLYEMFERAEQWARHAGAGHWPDADMLPVGAINQVYGDDERTKFTADEQITMLTLWCFMRSPLMIGGELTKTDDFTFKLLTNINLLEMLSNSWCAKQIYRRRFKVEQPLGFGGLQNAQNVDNPQGEEIIWFAPRKSGGYYIAVFNTGEETRAITAELSSCELRGEYEAFDLWNKTRFVINDSLTANVNAHGAAAFLLTAR